MENVTRLPVESERGMERRRLHLRDVSDGGTPPAGSVGEELRAARLRLGEDIRSVASALRIRKEHLEALEAGEIERLPGRTYAIGFIRSYADYLGLDSGAIVARLKDEAGALEPPVIDSRKFPDAEEETRPSTGPILIALAAVVAALIGAWYLVQSADRMIATGGSTASESSAAEAPAATPTPDVAAPGAPAPQASPAPEASAPAAAVPAAPAPGATPAPATGGRILGSQDPAARVEVVALRNNAWLRIEDQATGEVLITAVLKAGDRYRAAPERGQVVLVTRDAGALELVLDGTSLGPAGPSGSVLTGLPIGPEALAARTAAPR